MSVMWFLDVVIDVILIYFCLVFDVFDTGNFTNIFFIQYLRT